MPPTEITKDEYYEVVTPAGVAHQEQDLEGVMRCIDHFREKPHYKDGTFNVYHIKMVKEKTLIMIDTPEGHERGK